MNGKRSQLAMECEAAQSFSVVVVVLLGAEMVRGVSVRTHDTVPASMGMSAASRFWHEGASVCHIYWGEQTHQRVVTEWIWG